MNTVKINYLDVVSIRDQDPDELKKLLLSSMDDDSDNFMNPKFIENSFLSLNNASVLDIGQENMCFNGWIHQGRVLHNPVYYKIAGITFTFNK